jgi:S-adenosylmethionine decarboxylase
MLRDFKLDSYLFGVKEAELPAPDVKVATQRLKHEMAEIFYGTNMVRVS